MARSSIFLLAIFIALVLALAGCGGGGSGSSSSSPTLSSDTLTGTIVSSNGSVPLQNVLVLFGSGSTVKSGITDANGKFTIALNGLTVAQVLGGSTTFKISTDTMGSAASYYQANPGALVANMQNNVWYSLDAVVVPVGVITGQTNDMGTIILRYEDGQGEDPPGIPGVPQL